MPSSIAISANPVLLISSTAAPRQPRRPIPSSLPAIWRDIQGADNWRNLLHPILRHELLRYAQFVISSYKSFDQDPSSPRYLNSKYPMPTILSQSGLPNAPYQVTKYLYATPAASTRSHWIGYIAVSDDHSLSTLGRRDILVSFRGTVTNTEWLTNFMSSLATARLDPFNPRPDVKVESGFLTLYTSASFRASLLTEISRIVNLYKNDDELSITLAGHSMGSSLAVLFGYDLAELGLNRVGSGAGINRVIPVTVFSYGGPRVGNLGFKARCDELGVKVLRVVNVKDPVTKMPGLFLNENLRLPWSGGGGGDGGSCYAHVGVELALDFFEMENYPACVHDLEAYVGRLEGSDHEMEKGGGGENHGDFLRKEERGFFNLIFQKFVEWAPWLQDRVRNVSA
ncbi:galactolipase DONGLE, chloroplastic-like [Dendrobium catenatum]|uniref:Galactolipase DONGLE, chloroplastic n=1 Tax=Dendrobium catenatum TaxID=906689 RepID=A0A2I0WCX0_9ASPA|nr:galactolipase DONGLE, chloroplastic-like [Dendrobium catenatum]PKU73505.1 Galactolipase DONGLE, chloroplastic [Dendrobium catenatum]